MCGRNDPFRCGGQRSVGAFPQVMFMPPDDVHQTCLPDWYIGEPSQLNALAANGRGALGP